MKTKISAQFQRAFLALSLALSASSCVAQPTTPTSQTLPPVKLRGYGTLSGDYRALPNGASVLQINCESVAHAQLVQAKYLSDLSLLPGVTTATNGVRTIAGQGAVAAARQGKSVFVVTAATPPALAAVLKQQVKGAATFDAEIEVPMYLDRFDKFGFRFYYRPWEVPPGQSVETYDFTKEFDWARRQDRTGLVIWDFPHQADTAEGLMAESWFDWGLKGARANGLPVGINPTAGGYETPTWLLNRYRDQTELKMPGFVGNYHVVGSAGLGATGVISWNAEEAIDAEMGLLQESVRRFAREPNVTSFLEPHGEVRHGVHDLFLDYGPAADKGYRRFLKEKYQTPAAVSSATTKGRARLCNSATTRETCFLGTTSFTSIPSMSP